MGIFDGLDVIDIKNNQESIFDGLDVIDFNQSPAPSDPSTFSGEDSIGRVASRYGKSAVAGAVGGIADTASSIYNIPAQAFNYLKDKLKGEDPGVLASMGLGDFVGLQDRESPNAPIIPSATEGIDKGLDAVTGGYTATPKDETALHEGVKLASSVAGFGGVGKAGAKFGAKGIEKLGNVLGSTKPQALAGAGAVGAVTENAREQGNSELASVGKGAIAGVATEAALSGNPLRGLVKVMGGGKKSLNSEAIDAAQRIGVDLPLAAVSKAQTPNALHQFLSRIPIAGDIIAAKLERASSNFQKSFEGLLDKVGQRVDDKEDFSNIAKEIYKEFNTLVTEDAVISSDPLMKKIEEIRKNLKSLGSDSTATKEVLKTAEELEKGILKNETVLPDYLKNAPENIKSQITDKSVRDANIKEVIRQKIEINKKMKDKNLFNRNDTDSLDLMKSFAASLDEMLENYAKSNASSNPKFYEVYKKAQTEYGKLAKRENLENFLRDIISPPIDNKNPNFNALIKKLGSKKNKEFLKNNFGENVESLNDYVETSKAIESIKRNNKNPSGSGWINLISKAADMVKNNKFVGGAVGTASVGAAYLHPVSTGLIVTSIGGLTALTTSRRFVNLSNRYAKNPSPELAKKIETIIKDVTGSSARELGMNIYEDLTEESN